MMRKTVYALLFFALAVPAAALTINNPLPGESLESPVLVNLSTNQTQSNISYVVGSENGSCHNCTSLAETTTLPAGNHTLFAAATSGNETARANTTFSVREPFTLVLHAPQARNYTESVPLNASTSIRASLQYVLDDGPERLLCENCTSATQTLTNLSAGNHTLVVSAHARNQTRNRSVLFGVARQDNATGNQTGEENRTNETGPPGRFGPVYNKLPQAVARGELTDEELATIIRNNSLVPGVINRLIRTGELGNQSIDAIIQEQRTPPGILQKVFGFFGVHVPTAKERLAERYALSPRQKRALAASPDVSRQVSQRLRQEAVKEAGPPDKERGPKSAPAARERDEDKPGARRGQSERKDRAQAPAKTGKESAPETVRTQRPPVASKPAASQKRADKPRRKGGGEEKVLRGGGQNRRSGTERGPPGHARAKKK